MRRTLRPFTACFLTLAGFLASALAQTDPVADDQVRQAAKRLATECMRSYAGGDPARFIDLTHAKVVALTGGREKLGATIRALNEKMREGGWRYGEVTVNEPTQFAAMGSDLVTVVPCTVEYLGGERRKLSESYLIGVSSDRGKTWTFIEGAHTSRDGLKAILPNLPDSVRPPPKK